MICRIFEETLPGVCKVSLLGADDSRAIEIAGNKDTKSAFTDWGRPVYRDLSEAEIPIHQHQLHGV
ncbi:MAG: hypothetical protein Q7N50_04830 [Armatimonadota bacterium]|nr:hypothetical protein [Armatimonadota bacterium]